MKIRWAAFNTYLLATVLLLIGCKSPEERRQSAEVRKQKKELSTIRVHLEVNVDTTGRTTQANILRASPISINVLTESFLDERDVQSAVILENSDGFVVKIQFNDHGVFALENISSSNKGRRLAIMSNFGETRWLAAPVMVRPIKDGAILFTPDATREEAARFVRGLNNTLKKLKKNQLLPGS